MLHLRCKSLKKRARPGLEFMKDRSRTTQSHQVGLSFEIKEYFSLPCIPDDDNILGSWKSSRDKYSTLTRLAAIYLATHASSAPVERIFSIGGKIFRPERCRLNNDLFQTLMFIRCNDYN